MKKTNTSGKNFKVTRATEFENGNVGFTLEVNEVTIYNCIFIEGKKGDFISFPSRKGKDDKYYNLAYVKLTPEEVAEIKSLIEVVL